MSLFEGLSFTNFLIVVESQNLRMHIEENLSQLAGLAYMHVIMCKLFISFWWNPVKAKRDIT